MTVELNIIDILKKNDNGNWVYGKKTLEVSSVNIFWNI